MERGGGTTGSLPQGFPQATDEIMPSLGKARSGEGSHVIVRECRADETRYCAFGRHWVGVMQCRHNDVRGNPADAAGHVTSLLLESGKRCDEGGARVI